MGELNLSLMLEISRKMDAPKYKFMFQVLSPLSNNLSRYFLGGDVFPDLGLVINSAQSRRAGGRN